MKEIRKKYAKRQIFSQVSFFSELVLLKIYLAIGQALIYTLSPAGWE
jgi:hypothetical protein